ncbi:MAG: DUF1501 domain-containing protein [Pirellulales bacterium]
MKTNNGSWENYAELSRRSVMRKALQGLCGLGLGGIGLEQMAMSHLLAAEESGSGGVLRDKLHFPPKAKRVLQLFMNGGVSQMDTFDYKPELEKRHGQVVDVGLKATVTGTVGPVMKCPFPFKQHGECGRWVSDVFPHMATCVDDMAFLMAMASKTNVHGPASYLQTTGFLLPGFPCFGAWVGYALGSITNNLPTFVVLPDPRGLPYNGMGGFLGRLFACHSSRDQSSILRHPFRLLI